MVTPQRHNTKQHLKGVVRDKLTRGLGKVFSETNFINHKNDKTDQIKQQFVYVILEEILQHLELANQRGEIVGSKPTQTDIVKVLNRFQAQRRIIEVQTEWFQYFCEMFFSSASLFNSSEKVSFFVENNPNAVIDVFSKYLAQTIIKSFEGTGINFIIDQIQDSEISQILADLILLFTNPPNEYQVIGIVDGLDLQGKNLTMGKVRLYDARVWDYGEANLLDGLDLFAYRGKVEPYTPTPQTHLVQYLHSSYEYKGRYGTNSNQLIRHSARATTTVQTYDPKMAQELATIEMNQTLDTLTWVYTKKKRTDTTSSKFELLPSYVVINAREQTFHSSTSRDSPQLTQLNAQNENLAEFMQVYDPLFSLAEASRTQVEQSTLKALHWLAKGYWEIYPPNEFLNYWIALEQLLVQTGEGKLVGVRKRLPSLVSTWDRTEFGQQILKSCQELIDEIKTHQDIQTQLNAELNFANWQTNKTVLLQNLDLLEQMDTSKKLLQLLKLKTIFDPNQIINAKDKAQEKTRYQIGLLNDRRNLIVHEGYSYSPDMVYYTEILWSFARFAYGRVTDCICADIGKFKTIDDVIATYDTPW